MNYFISDLHFGHVGCISFDKRPFLNIEENDATIIKNWNSRVTDEDDVYVLGDISAYNATKTVEIFLRLKGRIHLIKGNHDTKLLKNKAMQDCFCEVTDYKEIPLEGKNGIVLCHYPIPCFRNHYHGWYHFYGHVHMSEEDVYMDDVKKEMVRRFGKPCSMYNVGCMESYINYTPRSLDEIVRGYDLMKIEKCSLTIQEHEYDLDL